PVRCAPGQPVADRLALKLVHRGYRLKRPLSSKQLTLTTARAPSVISATAATKTPQRRQMRKSQVRVPKYRSTRDQSSARTSNTPWGSESIRGLCLRQNEQVHARGELSSGALVSRRRTWMLPQWQPPRHSMRMSLSGFALALLHEARLRGTSERLAVFVDCFG